MFQVNTQTMLSFPFSLCHFSAYSTQQINSTPSSVLVASSSAALSTALTDSTTALTTHNPLFTESVVSSSASALLANPAAPAAPKPRRRVADPDLELKVGYDDSFRIVCVLWRLGRLCTTRLVLVSPH